MEPPSAMRRRQGGGSEAAGRPTRHADGTVARAYFNAGEFKGPRACTSWAPARKAGPSTHSAPRYGREVGGQAGHLHAWDIKRGAKARGMAVGGPPDAITNGVQRYKSANTHFLP